MIPVTFNKDDLENEKKGTMRAQDLASMVGLIYPKKVGILDIFDNPIVVTNIDLSTTGYVKLTFSKGYVVVYGRLIYVEQGELVTLPLPASTETGSIGIRINLAESGANEVEWFKSTETLTTNNLLNSPADGVYEFAIYNYTANSTTFTLGTRIAQVLPSIADYLAGANFTTQLVSDTSTKLATTEFVKNASALNVPRIDYINMKYDISFGRLRIFSRYVPMVDEKYFTFTYPEQVQELLGCSVIPVHPNGTMSKPTAWVESRTSNSISIRTSFNGENCGIWIVVFAWKELWN